MLGAGSYLLGCIQLVALAGFALLGGSALRARLTPDLAGPPSLLTTILLALALLFLVAELLGTLDLFQPLPLLLCTAAAGSTLQTLLPRVARRRGAPIAEGARSASEHMGEGRRDRTRGPRRLSPHPSLATPLALAVSAIALGSFALDARPQLGHGMTGFDSTWYHGPFAAGFFQSGDTWGLHLIAPQFLAWFYPANSELAHAVGMLAFERDILSPLLNIGWFAGCLLALWCVGRPYGAGLLSLALGAVALRLPAFADQAGEARNDIVGAFFLLAAAAVLVNARAAPGREGTPIGAFAVVGLAAGLAAGTKLNFLLPAAVLVVGAPALAQGGARARALGAALAGSAVGGGYWYLRNLAHAGNPLPWVTDLGPVSLPGPEQALGGREGHSVLGYLTDATVWADWFLPGLHDGLGVLAPLVLALAAAGILLALLPRSDAALRIAALAGLATALAWLTAPTSASGPEGIPRGFESGLRYLIPALALGLALLPPALFSRLASRRRQSPEDPSNPLFRRVARFLGGHPEERCMRSPNQRASRSDSSRAAPICRSAAAPGREAEEAAGYSPDRTRRPQALRGLLLGGACTLLLVAIAIGYPLQRHYLEGRYADPSFTAPGLNAAFRWARDVSDARIATTSTRQYPLFGTDLSNRVRYVGVERPHGGFLPPASCREWRRLLAEGDYDHVVASLDRIEPESPPFPATARWTQSPGSHILLKKPPTIVFRLSSPPDPSTCPEGKPSSGRARP